MINAVIIPKYSKLLNSFQLIHMIIQNINHIIVQAARYHRLSIDVYKMYSRSLILHSEEKKSPLNDLFFETIVSVCINPSIVIVL